METLEEIDQEVRECFLEMGGENLLYISCLNDREDHIHALTKILENEMSGWI